MKKTRSTDPPDGDSRREGARRYFQAVEEHFVRLRGSPILLSPKDVARVASWYEEGVPLRVVLQGIERHFERRTRGEPSRRQRIVTLAFCAEDVREAWKEGLALARGGDPRGRGGEPADAGPRATLEGVALLLRRARAARPGGAQEGPGREPAGAAASGALPLGYRPAAEEAAGASAAAGGAGEGLERATGWAAAAAKPGGVSLPPSGPGRELDAALESALQGVEQLLAGLGGAGGLDAEALEARLEGLDRQLVEALQAEAGEEECRRLRAACAAEIGQYRERMAPEIFSRTVERIALQRLRERWGIPQITLFAV